MLSMKLFSTKSILMAALMVSASAFADDAVSIRNVCDTLSGKINIKTAYIDEVDWYGPRDLSKADSVKAKRHKDYTTVAPLRNNMPYTIPLSIPAKCATLNYQSYTYAQWTKSTSSSWNSVTSNDDYSTIIYDVHTFNGVGNYNTTNSNNFLVLTANGIDDDNPSYSTGEIFVSKPFELNFDWWFAEVAYVSSVTTTTTASGTETRTSYKTGASLGMDSLSAVTNAMNTIPDTVSKVTLQILHAVMMDESKIPSDEDLFSSSSEALSSSSDALSSSSSEVTSSSSETPISSSEVLSSSSETPSSSSEVLSSSSEAPSSSSDEVSSSSESIGYSSESESSSSESISSSSEEELSSSSADDGTWIANLKAEPVLVGIKREMRRLDGSRVKQDESVAPGVYYVKGVNGLWKKQLVLPR